MLAVLFWGLAVVPAQAVIVIHVSQDEANGLTILGIVVFIMVAILLGIAATYYWLTHRESPQQKAISAQVIAFTKKAPVALRKQNWARVYVDEASGGSYKFIIHYRDTPDSYDRVAADTAALIRAVLEVIDGAGAPTDTVTVIRVSTKLAQRSVGSAFYGSRIDKIEFNPPKEDVLGKLRGVPVRMQPRSGRSV